MRNWFCNIVLGENNNNGSTLTTETFVGTSISAVASHMIAAGAYCTLLDCLFNAWQPSYRLRYYDIDGQSSASICLTL
ncbi:conserved hypothetical protein [Ricinus communis]|uniref:Uncharacterized protein n=1 Tax=Ricinus communis TaxID=3988 RepID=B9SLQ8_RICCO|nr:conserved hypothetical protein [Ricinus communis]